MMDNLLLISILMIFFGAFVATMIRYRTRDKCLKDFTKYFVTLESKDGKKIWGRLNIYHNGLELIYPSSHLDPDGDHFETSYIMYQDQYSSIYAIMRLHDELDPENQERREKELLKTYHPNTLRRTGRKLRNLLNLFRDAFSQALSVFIGHVKKTGGSSFVASQDGRLQNTANSILGTSNAAYEPMLEKYIGHKVVLEIMNDGKVRECCGILKEYTDKFITLLDVPAREEHEFNLSDPQQLKVNKDLDFELTSEPCDIEGDVGALNLHIHMKNNGKETIQLCHAEGEGYSCVLDKEIKAGEEIDFDLPGIPLPRLKEEEAGRIEAAVQPEDSTGTKHNLLPDVRLWIRATRLMDMVVPRSRGMIRHGAESIGQMNIRFALNLRRT